MTKNEAVSYVNSAIFVAGTIYIFSGMMRRHVIKKALKIENQRRSDSSLKAFNDIMNAIFPQKHPEDAPHGPAQEAYDKQFRIITEDF